MTDMCGDNRFEVIKKAKEAILQETNISSSPYEMDVLDAILYRCWQMGWLKKYEPIDEEELDRIAVESYNETGYIGEYPMTWYTEGFKIGYREAKR